MTTTLHTGGCLCGQIRFRISAPPVAVRICWCRDCQHIAGNGTVNAIFPSAAIEISRADGGADVQTYASVSESGNTVQRRFCPRCGSHLFADSSGRPGLTVVRVGTLDEPSALRPSAHIWASSAPAWACLSDALERVERQPAPLARPAAS